MLQRTMLKTQAWERLQDRGHSASLSMLEFKRLLLDAGYSRKVAHEAAMQRGWDRLCADTTI